MRGKTALARWIDAAALCGLALMCGFWLMYSATGNVNVALTVCIISAALLAPAAFGISRAARERRGRGYTPELGRKLALYLITKLPDDARAEFISWLDSDESMRNATLILLHPDYPFTAQDALAFWQTRAGELGSFELYVTADIADAARELCARLTAPTLVLHPLRDIYALSRDKLPDDALNSPTPPLRQRTATFYHALVRPERAGRYAAYGLSLLLMGRLLALPYVRVPGLICLALWLLCVAEPPE